MIRILHVLNNLGSGGAESFVMSIYRNIDRSKIQFDFLIRSTYNGPIMDEIKELGGSVYIQPSFPRHLIRNYLALDAFLKERHKDYKAIHVHANALIYVRPLKISKKYGIPIRIIHSHSTNSSVAFVHKWNIRRIDQWVTNRFACSDLAGKWMFPDKKFKVIPNGIDMFRYQFKATDRETIRNKYLIGKRIVIGNVARFTPTKNHRFMIDIFEEYHRKQPNSVLMFIGEGDEKEKIETIVRQKGLSDSVIFTGKVPDVWRYLSAMDMFLFPSSWEGFGIAALEAQVNGMPCFVSEAIPKSVKISDDLVFIPLCESPQFWANKMLESKLERCESIYDNRFDVRNISKMLEEFYINAGGANEV